MKKLTLILAFVLIGCATVNDGQDPVVVRSEQTIETATEIMDAYITWADQNRRGLSLDAAKVAQNIKDHGADYIQSSLNALDAYIEGSASQSDLDTWVLLLQRLTEEATKYLPTE